LRLTKVIVLASLLLMLVSSVLGDTTSSEPARLLPARIGKYGRAATTPQSQTLKQEGLLTAEGGSAPIAADEAEYLVNGARVLVEIVRFRQDAEAYELLSLASATARGKEPAVEIGAGLGTAGYTGKNEVAFFKGAHFIRIRNVDGSANLNELAQTLNENIDKGEADIPALIKHLPNPEEAQKHAIYLNTFAELNKLGLEQPVLSAVVSGGNADAVLAAYGPSKVLIVEFNTPQLAKENDERIITRIHELWNLGQPAPTAYRRVGNYSVFVFDAPDEQTAKQLIEQVKYEQVVQWLGENPNIYKEAEKRYVNTTLGVLVAVVKASGYALVGCLGMGALIGGLLFTYRRAQQKGVTFSDAGGMLRLNLDELTAETNPARLLRDRN
jgi:hypothetical protein